MQTTIPNLQCSLTGQPPGVTAIPAALSGGKKGVQKSEAHTTTGGGGRSRSSKQSHRMMQRIIQQVLNVLFRLSTWLKNAVHFDSLIAFLLIQKLLPGLIKIAFFPNSNTIATILVVETIRGLGRRPFPPRPSTSRPRVLRRVSPSLPPPLT